MMSVSIKKSVCIILSTLITLAFLLSNAAGILPGHNIVRAAGEGHKHSGALNASEDEHAGWTAWNNDSSLPTDPGSYYLTTDVTLTSGTWVVPAGTTNLCLNGRSITAMGDFNAINIENSGIVLNLYDESGNGGTITHDDGKSGSGVYVKGGTFAMFGGTITENKADYGGGVFVNRRGTFDMSGGTISGNTAGNGGGVDVDSGTFTMSGGAISGNTAGNGGGVDVDTGTFTMSDGTISGNIASDKGGGVFVDDGTFTMEKGTITGNTAKYGGGVNVYHYHGIFTMKNGTISGNTGSYEGGGVCVRDYGKFTMEGGTVSGNTVANYFGGGVDVWCATFNMSGGTISGNTAYDGGGVFVYYYGTFTMSGGTITGNTADYGGGAFIYSDNATHFIVSGSPMISENTNVDGDADNLYLCDEKYIEFGGALTPYDEANNTGALIGVTTETVPTVDNAVVFTSGLNGDLTSFVSDNGVFSVVASGTEAALVRSRCKITFMPNGGSGTMDPQIVSANVSTALTSNAFTLSNYNFAGWNTKADGSGDPYSDKQAVTLKDDITLYAQWTPIKYTIKFVDDGTELSSKQYDYGTAAADIVKPADPTKAPTAQNTYTFEGWSPDVADVTGDATYTATYSSSINEYTIKFVDDTGKELSSAKYDYGTKAADIVIPDTYKAATAQYTYEFKNWDKVITDVIADATYTAVYTTTVNKYTVKFVNEDGTVVSSKQYDYGTKAADIVKPADPIKAPTAQYSYTFDGWTPEIKDVTGDATYTAKFSSTVNKYTVKFVNEDGTVLQSDKVAYGETPSYTGKTPVKADTEDYTYTFSGWSPEISKVTGDATYKAVFTEKQKVGTYYLKNIEGDGKGGDIIATFGRTENDENAINYLDKVKADGKVLTRDKDYTAKKGSVIITIKKAYLDTLSEGTHTLEVCFTDGASVTLDFTVKHQAKYHVGTNTNANAATSTNTNTNTKAQASVPATGEKVAKTVFIGVGCVILACALAGGVFAMKMKRKEEA